LRQNKLERLSYKFFLSNLIFVSGALIHKCWTSLKKRAWDKHSSLFCHTFCDEETSFMILTPTHVTVRHFPFRPRKSDESLKSSKFGRRQFRETALGM
jgi:hypothetical protein